MELETLIPTPRHKSNLTTLSPNSRAQYLEPFYNLEFSHDALASSDTERIPYFPLLPDSPCTDCSIRFPRICLRFSIRAETKHLCPLFHCLVCHQVIFCSVWVLLRDHSVLRVRYRVVSRVLLYSAMYYFSWLLFYSLHIVAYGAFGSLTLTIHSVSTMVDYPRST
jgi:hypothetical protein